jgi:hypothetical protein
MACSGTALALYGEREHVQQDVRVGEVPLFRKIAATSMQVKVDRYESKTVFTGRGIKLRPD